MCQEELDNTHAKNTKKEMETLQLKIIEKNKNQSNDNNEVAIRKTFQRILRRQQA